MQRSTLLFLGNEFINTYAYIYEHSSTPYPVCLLVLLNRESGCNVLLLNTIECAAAKYTTPV